MWSRAYMYHKRHDRKTIWLFRPIPNIIVMFFRPYSGFLLFLVKGLVWIGFKIKGLKTAFCVHHFMGLIMLSSTEFIELNWRFRDSSFACDHFQKYKPKNGMIHYIFL